jgi:hypothetical protein
MALVPIYDVGVKGVNFDLPPTQLSPTEWSNMRNVAVRGDCVQLTSGQSALLTPDIAPYYLQEAPLWPNNYWLCAGLKKVYAILGALMTDITRASGGDYSADPYGRWNGGSFNGIPFLNNAVDVPQVWDPIDLSQKLIDLPDWPAATTAKVLRSYKGYLIALGPVKSGSYYPRMVKWSDVAEPGYLPGSWDESDPTKDAGEVILSEGTDGIVDCKPLGDANILYTENSTWSQSLTGTDAIFAFSKIFEMSGMLAQDCVQALRGKHFVVTQEDIVVHNGTTMESVAERRVRDWFFRNLDSSAYNITFTLLDRRNREIWICFPSSGGVCDLALIWNWHFNTWTTRDLPGIRAGASSISSPVYTNDLWDYGDSYTWEEESVQTWQLSGQATLSAEAVIISPPDTSGILLVDSSETFAGVEVEGTIEKDACDFLAVDSDGKPAADFAQYKHVLAIHPIVDAVDGTEIYVTVGSQTNPRAAVVWGETQIFIVGLLSKTDHYISGQHYAVKFMWKTECKFLGYYIDVVPLGQL